MFMSSQQKENMTFLTVNFARVVLTVCGALLTILYYNMQNDVMEFKSEVKKELNEQGKDFNAIKVDLATVKAYVRYGDK